MGFTPSASCRLDIRLLKKDGSTYKINSDTSPTQIEIIDNTDGEYESICYISLYVAQRYVLNDLIVKIMIENISTSTYYPYKLSRQSLRNDIPIFKDMTQSEYDALSDSEKNNGVYYNIIMDEDN